VIYQYNSALLKVCVHNSLCSFCCSTHRSYSRLAWLTRLHARRWSSALPSGAMPKRWPTSSPRW
jgi:hypothetical protein